MTLGMLCLWGREIGVRRSLLVRLYRVFFKVETFLAPESGVERAVLVKGGGIVRCNPDLESSDHQTQIQRNPHQAARPKRLQRAQGADRTLRFHEL